MKDESRVVVHGADCLPAVTVAAYNCELRAGKGFIGDRASNKAFRELLEKGRQRLREVGEDPLGDKPTEEVTKKKLDKTLIEGDPEAAGVVQGAIEEFALELAKVTARYLRLKAWQGVERIVVGGGFRASRIGELAIGRASVLIKDMGHDVHLLPIHYDPDEAGLIGALHLVPAWMLTGHDAIVAVDIGGSNIRAGIVEFHLQKKSNIVDGSVRESELWRYVDESEKPSRDEAVERIVQMVKPLVHKAGKNKLTLAPFVGVACPGVITAAGEIERGGQNLPGNWHSNRFNLPAQIRELLPTIDDHEITVVMHNDAVVQGLSELPFMQEFKHWAVLTIGTGLGNAVFTNAATVADD